MGEALLGCLLIAACTSRDIATSTTTQNSTTINGLIQNGLTTNGIYQNGINNPDGSSIFKLNTTVPVKFQLTGASASITNLVATLSIAKLSNAVDGTVVEATSSAAADSGNTFRYDPVTGQYIFNLSTSGLSKGTWLLHSDTHDGVDHSIQISLK